MYTNEANLSYILIITLVIVALLIGAFLLAMYFLYRRYLQLHSRFETASIDAQEAERRIVALDLHDDIGPFVLAARNKLSGARVNPAKADSLLDEATDHLTEIYNRLKQISVGLVPQSLSSDGPIHAVYEFIERSLEPLPFEFDMNVVVVTDAELSREKSTHVFRILQEIAVNTVKHSQATEFSIESTKRGNVLVISTADNGIGFHYDRFGMRTGHGLQNIFKRAEMAGARISIDSAPGKGTCYTITVPLKPQQ